MRKSVLLLATALVATLLGAPVAGAQTTEAEVSPQAIDNDAVTDRVGLVDPATGGWHLRGQGGAVASFFYGNPGDVPFMGDWNCDGIDTPGLFRTSDAFAYLRNSNTQGIADIRFFFGNPSDIPLAGDFDGDGCDSLSIYRPAEQRFYIINELGANNGGLGAADFSFVFGNPGDKPFVGDFNGDGIDSVGLHRESTGFVYFRQSLTTGVADSQFFFGDPGDRFVAGDWGIVDNVDTPAVFRPSNTTFFFRHSNTQGNADESIFWGQSNMLPVSGFWNVTGTPPGGPGPAPTDFSCNEATGIFLGDCLALVDLYASTGGQSWTERAGWLVSKTPCLNWSGVLCFNGRVSGLTRTGVNLTGALPDSIGNLTGLTSLIISSNPMGGFIPTSIGNLTSLVTLDLSGNAFVGSIPPGVSGLTNLTTLDLNGNTTLGGPIRDLQNLKLLTHLNLSENALDGPIPPGLGFMTSIQEIQLNNNGLDGALPSTFWGLNNLHTLDVSFNQLNEIQTGPGTAPSLDDLDISNNFLGGDIGTTLAKVFTLTFLTELDASTNQLIGPIPAAIGALSALQALDLSGNGLTGPIPMEITQLINIPQFVAPAEGDLGLCPNPGLSTAPPPLDPIQAFVDTRDHLWMTISCVA